METINDKIRISIKETILKGTWNQSVSKREFQRNSVTAYLVLFNLIYLFIVLLSLSAH